MGKCRYDLSEDCNNTDCINCMLDKIRAEIEKAVWEDSIYSRDGADEVRIPRLDPDDVFAILDKYSSSTVQVRQRQK